ncbi:hypothetical protein THF1A12_50276 [Vibrio jasicida]|uniref:Uncharacterized protein n=1 Tax=Vibrio jasicida TaxID=766224 RepID=A0AAU9QTQ4_9VIBR|nr:hypothetical protein THF1A12_50276 [Vibrio jasicida]
MRKIRKKREEKKEKKECRFAGLSRWLRGRVSYPSPFGYISAKVKSGLPCQLYFIIISDLRSEKGIRFDCNGLYKF